MNKSNTTAKGDIIEKKVFELLEALLENEDFFVPGKRSKIFWKKAYYSELKRGDIIVDISIETFLPKEYINDNFDVENTIFLNHVESKKINKRMEIQANIFATNLLLPKFAFLKIVSEYFIKERIHRNYLFLDNQPCNRYLVYNLLGELKCKFGVSHEVAKNRLVSMKLLKDETDTSISNVMRNY